MKTNGVKEKRVLPFPMRRLTMNLHCGQEIVIRTLILRTRQTLKDSILNLKMNQSHQIFQETSQATKNGTYKKLTKRMMMETHELEKIILKEIMRMSNTKTTQGLEKQNLNSAMKKKVMDVNNTMKISLTKES
ncbi:unnamed protein product [Arabis nemorensis]|uniref:Uncharacterized protein n=1 Tax=Arabis nemorensis TaxID=586526 RepID=A0A565CNV4_9BRAS|nr:unnamed protein product [Arabis nemorensis]